MRRWEGGLEEEVEGEKGKGLWKNDRINKNFRKRYIIV